MAWVMALLKNSHSEGKLPNFLRKNKTEILSVQQLAAILNKREQVSNLEQVCMSKFEQVWASLNKSEQVWTSLNKLEQVWTCLNKPEQVLTSLKKLEQVIYLE